MRADILHCTKSQKPFGCLAVIFHRKMAIKMKFVTPSQISMRKEKIHNL